MPSILISPCYQARDSMPNSSIIHTKKTNRISDPRCKPSFLSSSWIPHKNEGSSSAASWGTDLPPPPFGLGKPWNVIPGSARAAPCHWLDEVNIRTILPDMLFCFPIETWGLGLSSKCVSYILIYLSNSRTIVSWQAPALDSLDVVSELTKLHSRWTFSSLKGTTNAPWSSLNSTMEATKKSTCKMSSYTGVQFVNKNIVGSTSYDYMFHQPMVDWRLVAWNPKPHEGSHPHSCSDFICGHRSNACYSAVHIIHHDTSLYIKVEQIYGYLWMINSPKKDMWCFCGSKTKKGVVFEVLTHPHIKPL